MIIPQFKHICGTINSEQVVNLQQDQGIFKIEAILVKCTGCGKHQIIMELKESYENEELKNNA